MYTILNVCINVYYTKCVQFTLQMSACTHIIVSDHVTSCHPTSTQCQPITYVNINIYVHMYISICTLQMSE